MARVFGNVPAQSELKIPLKKLAVVQICREYGVDISGDSEWLKSDICGATDYLDVGRIDLTPNAFKNTEQLLRTILHEGCHVRQLRKYGAVYVQENRLKMERIAYRYEDFFYRLKAIRNVKNE